MREGSATSWVEVDGAFGEGGGQVLRTSLSLSALTGRPTRIRRIRAGRRRPGLAPQHLTTVLALGEICGADISGATLRSTELTFRPGRLRPGDHTFDVEGAAQGGSAGSMTLVFQALLLPLAFAGGRSRLTLRGGTHVPWSPPFDYLTGVFLPVVGRMGVGASTRLERAGFYPRGGGEIQAEVQPLAASREPLRDLRDERPAAVSSRPSLQRPFNPAVPALTPLSIPARGALLGVEGRALACSLPAHVAQRMTDRARSVLGQAGIVARLSPARERGPGPGAGIFLVAEYEHAPAGFSALGERGKPSERVAEEACADLLAHHQTDASVDPHLADQLLLPAALARGRSEYRTSRITSHLLTNAYAIRRFLDARIAIDGVEGEAGTVVVDGAPPPESSE